MKHFGTAVYATEHFEVEVFALPRMKEDEPPEFSIQKIILFGEEIPLDLLPKHTRKHMEDYVRETFFV